MDGAKANESPADFLKHQGETLCGTKGIDGGIAGILAKHLLTATPAIDAVTKAREAILQLAAERASQQNPQVSNG